jgi:hypothetical protein
VIDLFPSKITEELNKDLMERVTDTKIFDTLSAFQKSKSPGLDGMPVEFYLSFYDFLKEDIPKVVLESQESGWIFGPLNKTFLALIRSRPCLPPSLIYRPISCCNLIYKLISKIIANRIKPILSNYISEEQFGFLFKQQIHDAMSLAQEAMHSMKVQKIPLSY